MVSDDEGWVTGKNVLLRRDKGRWVATEGSYRRLHSIDMLSQDEGWIVGNFGTILHWNGTIWNPVENPAQERQQRLRSVSFSSPENGWVLDFTTGTIWHYDGKAWKESFTS